MLWCSETFEDRCPCIFFFLSARSFLRGDISSTTSMQGIYQTKMAHTPKQNEKSEKPKMESSQDDNDKNQQAKYPPSKDNPKALLLPEKDEIRSNLYEGHHILLSP